MNKSTRVLLGLASTGLVLATSIAVWADNRHGRPTRARRASGPASRPTRGGTPGSSSARTWRSATGSTRTLPDRIAQWKAQGYIPHLMTGVSWGEYQDYLYGRFDGVNHVDEAQTDRNGKVISHGGDVYYMSPGENFGKFLCQGVKRAMDAGAEAIHLEEPEFWVRGG